MKFISVKHWPLDNPPTYLCLQQCVSKLRVVKQQLPCFLRIVLDEPFHLLHEFKHLLRREACHCLGDNFRGVLWGNWGSMERRLGRKCLWDLAKLVFSTISKLQNHFQ